MPGLKARLWSVRNRIYVCYTLTVLAITLLLGVVLPIIRVGTRPHVYQVTHVGVITENSLIAVSNYIPSGTYRVTLNVTGIFPRNRVSVMVLSDGDYLDYKNNKFYTATYLNKAPVWGVNSTFTYASNSGFHFVITGETATIPLGFNIKITATPIWWRSWDLRCYAVWFAVLTFALGGCFTVSYYNDILEEVLGIYNILNV